MRIDLPAAVLAIAISLGGPASAAVCQDKSMTSDEIVEAINAAPDCARAMKLLQGLSRRFWYLHYKEAADLPLCAQLHAEQARAIAKGEPTRAAKASDNLLDYIASFTRATVNV